MVKVCGLQLGGRNFRGGAISSPLERFSWWRLPSLDTTKTALTGKMLVGRGAAAGRGTAEFGAGGSGGAGFAARPVKSNGGGIYGVALTRTGASHSDVFDCGV